MTPEKLERARCIVEAVVNGRMGDIVFHETTVKPNLEKYGDDLAYLKVRAIYESEMGQFHPRRSAELRSGIRRRLHNEGITEFPVLCMTTRSDWDQHPDPE